MEETAFTQWIFEGGQVSIPLRLLEKMQSLNLPPENLGYLIMAMARCQEGLSAKELAQDKWIKWSLAQGWAKWQGQGDKKHISFSPLWNKIYEIWSQSGRQLPNNTGKTGEFDYGKILKWLDQERGTLSITLREKQVIQEFNLKYGWSTEFILIFLQLVFERGYKLVHLYAPVAKRVYESGTDTVEGLISFIDNIDWIRYKVAEINKCIGQYGGVTAPQREMYLKWQNKWKFGHDLILRAAEETVRTSNPNFKYIDAVLQNWYQEGVKDIRDAETVLQKRDLRENETKSRKVNKKRISRVDNRDWENM